MSGPAGSHASAPASTRSAAWVALLGSLVIGALALDHQSFWIDEFGTWRLTRADGLGAWLTQLLGWPNSDAQLPIYHAWMKLWSSIVPRDEWALRASNLPWLALALFPYWRAPVQREAIPLIRLAGLVCALHPLTWYYVDELRPYTMVLAATSFAGVGLASVWMESETPAEARLGRHFLLAGLALLAACSPVGVIWTVAFAPAAYRLSRGAGRAHGFDRGHGVAAALYLVLLLPVFAQYLATFLAGVSASLIDNKLVNFVFAFYELLGLGGLGPGRDELRIGAAGALRAQAPALVLAVPLLLGTLAWGVRALGREWPGRAWPVLAASLLPVLILYGLAEVKHWRVVGRHLLPWLFFVSLVFAAGLRATWRRGGGRVARAVTALALLALVGSSLDIRWATRHRRELYDVAAREAANALAAKRDVWWFATDSAPEFFGMGAATTKRVSADDYRNGSSRLYAGMHGRVVDDCRRVVSPALLVFERPSADLLVGCPAPATVIYSRREAFDPDGAGAAWLRAHGYQVRERFNGFEIWR